MLTILGLGLAAYLAWVGIQAYQHMPLVMFTDRGMMPVHKRTAQALTIIATTAEVAIILLLVSEIA